MDRRKFLIGIAGASTASIGFIRPTAADERPGRGNGNGRGGSPSGDPVKNTTTGETYDSLATAASDLGRDETLSVQLATSFSEDVAIDTPGVTVEAAGHSRITTVPGETVIREEVTGNDAPEIDGGTVLWLDSRGTSDPTIAPSFDRALIEATGNATPTVTGDLDQLLVSARGNATVTVEGDISHLATDTRGNATVSVDGEIGTESDVGFGAQPTIEGSLTIDAEDVTVDGIDVKSETVGIDVRTDDSTSLGLFNMLVTGADGEGSVVDPGEPAPDSGVGVRLRGNVVPEALQLGGERGPNVVTDNAVGVSFETDEGMVADVDSRTVRADNVVRGNDVNVLPEPGDPKGWIDPQVTDDVPVEVVSSEREDGDALTGHLPDFAIDEAETISMRAIGIALDSAEAIELTIDPTQPDTDSPFVDGYGAIEDGGFSVETPLDPDDIEAVRFALAVDRERIEDPDQFTLQREVGGAFEPLRTELVSETPTHYHFAALSPGFSNFQVTEFDIQSVGGPGREVDGELLMPSSDPVDATFVSVETSTDIDEFDVEMRGETLDPSERFTIDFESDEDMTLPTSIYGFGEITNTGSESATVRTSTGLSRAPLRATLVDVDLPNEFEGELPITTLSEEYISLHSDPLELEPGESATLSLEIGSVDPEDELWINLGVPALHHETNFQPAEPDEFLKIGHQCESHGQEPILFHQRHATGTSPGWVPDDADGDSIFLLVPAILTINWHGGDRDDDVTVGVHAGNANNLIGVHDFEEVAHDGTVDTWGYTVDGDDFGSGPVTATLGLVFQSDCDPDVLDQPDAEIIVGNGHIMEDLGDVELLASLNSGERWAEIAGEDQVVSQVPFHGAGVTAQDIANSLTEEAFERFAEGVLNAVTPGPVMTYRAAWRAATLSRGNPLIPLLWTGLESAITRHDAVPDNLDPVRIYENALIEGVINFTPAEEPFDLDLPPQFENNGLTLSYLGPSIMISSEPSPSCADPDVRTRTVEGQVTGGPVVLMGLDSEEGAGYSGHGPPEEHAAMVASILENVSNGGEGILVLGGDPGSATGIVEYWREDIANDSRVNEEVTFVNGASEIRDVDFEGYAMIGVVSSDNEIWNGLVDSENEALAERQGDIAAFINSGGGLLGKTQDGLNDPWSYISPVADITSTLANNSSIEVTPAGEEFGLTQSGMDGWCCYHESFEEDSIPEFMEVLLRNPEQRGDPPAAIGGESVVVQTAVEMEVTGPANVEVDDPTTYEVGLGNAADEAGEDVRLDVSIERHDGIEDGDIELAEGELTLEDGTLSGTLTDEPIEFTPDLDVMLDRTLTFAETGRFDVVVEIVAVDSDETVVRLPFSIRGVSEERGICED